MEKRLFIVLTCLAFLLAGATAQKRTTQATLYKEFKPSTITLKDGRRLKQPFTNVFLKNSTLVYISGTHTMEANMDQIASVDFPDRSYINIERQLAYLIDSVGSNALYRIDLFDMDAYSTQLRNNVNISNLEIGEMVNVTTMDLNNEDDYKFPVFPKFYYFYNGEFIHVHERDILRRLPSKNKDLRRMFKTIIGEPTFSWSDNESLVRLLKAITPATTK